MKRDANQVDFENEREWRRLLWERLDRVEQKQNQLLNSMTIVKYKVGLISSGVSFGAAIIFAFIQKKLGL